MLRVATFAAGSWQILSGASVDMQGQTVSGTTTHLSPYGITTAAAGAMCATVSGGVSCGGGGPAAGVDASAPLVAKGSGPSGGNVAAVLSGGGNARQRATAAHRRRTVVTPRRAACPAPAPRRPTPARSYPGATMTGCTDGPNGYMATCCFPSGGSICLAAERRGRRLHGGLLGRRLLHDDLPAAADLRQRDDRQRVRRPDRRHAAELHRQRKRLHGGLLLRARRAGLHDGRRGAHLRRLDRRDDDLRAGAHLRRDGNPCAGIEGATMQSCTDSADGYSAVCCLPVGVVPSAGSGNSGTVSVDGGVAGGSGSGTAGTSGGLTGAGERPAGVASARPAPAASPASAAASTRAPAPPEGGGRREPPGRPA